MNTEARQRQHRVLRSYPTPLSHQRRYAIKVDSSSVATKFSTKPTDQSNFTGNARCRDFQDFHWVRKYRVKAAKGSNNNRRSMGSDSAGLMMGFPAGTSAGDALAYLARSEASYDDDDNSTNYSDVCDYNDDDANYKDEDY